MDLVLAIFILILIGVIFFKEIKNTKEIDLFMDFIPTIIVIIASVFQFKANEFKFNYITDYIYIVSIVISIAYTIYFLVKYFKLKKSKAKEDALVDKGEN